MPKLRFLQNEKGFTLVELLIVIAIIGILATIAVPQYNEYRIRAYDADSKAHLHLLYLSCSAYWSDNFASDICTTAIVQQASYAFTPSSDMTLTYAGTSETAFTATASHTGSSNTFTIDSSGNIS